MEKGSTHRAALPEGGGTSNSSTKKKGGGAANRAPTPGTQRGGVGVQHKKKGKKDLYPSPRWVPTRDQDLADPPEWAAVRGSHRFRTTGAGPLCGEISRHELPPVLVERDRRIPRYPAYVLPHDLWQHGCAKYPDLMPDETELGDSHSAREFRNHVWAGMLRPAAYQGRHSFAFSEQEDWHVAFVPRLWLEELWSRMSRDGFLP